jgi:2-polyprenyl-6-methoxyphenol hydroxylase-like FAD-dependent oxidoreductase
MRNVKKLLVVGGGTAGLVSAIILKRKLDIEIRILKQDKTIIIKDQRSRRIDRKIHSNKGKKRLKVNS